MAENLAVKIVFSGDTSGLKAASEQAANSVGKVGSSVDKAGGGFRGLVADVAHV